MKVYDLSVVMRPEMPVWPGESGPTRELRVSTAAGDICNVSLVTYGSHTGTHVDAPFHFIPQGKTLEQVALDRLVGPARVIEIAGDRHIGAAALDAAVASGALPPGTERILFKTRNTERSLMQMDTFQQDFIAVAPDGAAWLVAHGVRTVGVDYLSVEQFGPPEPQTHWTLLGAEVFVIEGLDLRDVPPGDYTLVCGPLKFAHGDGSPARVFLLPPYPA